MFNRRRRRRGDDRETLGARFGLLSVSKRWNLPSPSLRTWTGGNRCTRRRGCARTKWRTDKHAHIATFHDDRSLEHGGAAQDGKDAFQYIATNFLVAHLRTAELDGDLYLVAILHEASDHLSLCFDVVFIDDWRHAHFFEIVGALSAVRLLFLLLLLILVATEVHEPAHRRNRVGGYFDEVEAAFPRHVECCKLAVHTKLLAVFTDDPYFPRTNLLVDTNIP